MHQTKQESRLYLNIPQNRGYSWSVTEMLTNYKFCLFNTISFILNKAPLLLSTFIFDNRLNPPEHG